METYTDTDTEKPPEPEPSRWRTMKVPLWALLLAVVLLIGALAWHQISVRQIERRHDTTTQELTQKLNADRSAMRAQANDALASASADAHRLFGTALAWTIRSSLLRNNYDEIDQYFAQLVKNPRIRLALLADPNGKIVLASDRAYQDAAFDEHFPAALLQESGVAIHAAEGPMRRLVLPIHGLSDRLGTALVVYEAPALPPS